MNNLPLFELRSVSKSYGEEAVVDQLSLSLHTGEIFGLLGESGAGKSTLLQLAANLINPDLGEVWLGGEKLPLPSDLLIPGHPDIKIVHQDYGLSPNLSVRENIRYALRYYEKNFRDARIEELLELCQLQAQAEQPAKLLSGGEKQRTAIARALAEEAQILLLDEPFAHLDLLNNRRLAETIRKSVALSGAACIFVTHHATDALGLSQRMGILQQGSLIQVGTPQEIYHQPLNAYVAGLSGEANVLDLTLATQYFGRHDWHVLPDAQVLIRPEYLHVQATPGADGLKAEVRSSIFEGSRYRVCVRLGQFDLMVYSDKAVKEKQEVGISVV